MPAIYVPPSGHSPWVDGDASTGTPRSAVGFLSSKTREGLRSALASCALALGSAAGSAHALPLPADVPVGAGHLVVTAAGPSVRFEVRQGARVLEAWDVASALTDVTVEEASSAGRTLVVVRATGAGEHVAVLDPRPRPHVVWRGRTDLHGDPGERVADALERRDIDADGRPDLVVGQRREGVGACGEPPQLLFARALDARGVLRPVQPVVSVEGLPVLVATPSDERPRPIVPALRFTASSSVRGGEESAVALGPPFGLTDGDPATSWAEGRGGGGDGEVLRAQWGGPPITGLELRAPDAQSLPRRLIVRLDATAMVVTLPESVGAHAFVALPAPARASCVSITLADGTARTADAQLGFSEIAAFSIADERQGLEALVDLLVADASDGDRAVGWLAAAGEGSIAALAASWERLGARGRRRALRVGLALEARGADATRAQIRELRARAARDEDLDVRNDAVMALARGDDADRTMLFEVALSEPAASPLAASALARGRGLPASASASIERLTHESWDRAALRSAIAQAVMREPSWRSAITSPSLDGPSLAALALGLAEARAADVVDTSAEPIVASLAERALTSEAARTDFVTRFRIARAARTFESPGVDAWLDATARSAEEWMLRAEAVEALGARASRELLGVLLVDRYPRVRLAAARAVARRGHEIPTLVALARHDAWPLVRAYALQEIADAPGGREAMLEALRDPASAMRASALDLLRTRSAPDVDAPLIVILEDALEWPHVTARAVELAEARCSDTLGPALVRVIDRGARAEASPGHLETAQLALRVALRMGGTTEASARRAAEGPAAPAFQVLLSHPQPPCGGRATPEASTPAAATHAGVPSAL
jgi:hypothetical protein